METAAQSRLPQQFAALEPFVAHWAAASPAARAAARDTASADQATAFHAAMSVRITEILDCLDAKPLAAMNRGEATLLNMALAFVHAVLGIEMQADAEPRHRTMRRHMKITAWPAEG